MLCQESQYCLTLFFGETAGVQISYMTGLQRGLALFLPIYDPVVQTW